MTRIVFLKKYLLKFAVALAMLSLIVYVLGHAFGFADGSPLTTSVQRITDRQITSAKAYLFRNETVLTSPALGLVDELVESGTKVGKDVAVVNVWSSEVSAEVLASSQKKLNRINQAIGILEKSQPSVGSTASHAVGYREDAVAAYLEICRTVEQGNLEFVLSLEQDMIIGLNRYLTLSSKQEGFDKELESLRLQKEQLLANSTVTTVSNTLSSGVFYGASFVDGYESVFTQNALKELDLSKFQALKITKPQQDNPAAVGKMVYGYSWYAAMELPQEVASNFKVGNSYEICFSQNGGKALPLGLEQMEVGNDRALVVFRCDQTPSDFVYYRSQIVELTVSVCEGLYLPETAIHTVNGAVGVYVLEDSVVTFRRIDVLYWGDGYCIARRSAESKLTELDENDILIVTGDNLYDGKVYQ